MNPRAGLDECGKFLLPRDLIPGPSSPYRVAIRNCAIPPSQVQKFTYLKFIIQATKIAELKVVFVCGIHHKIFSLQKMNIVLPIKPKCVGGVIYVDVFLSHEQ
jgi:hypothetical protein